MILITGRSINVASNLVGYTPYLYHALRDGTSGVYTFDTITLPVGVSATLARPVFTMHPGGNNKRTSITGMFSPQLVIAEDISANIAGLPAPTTAPVIAAGAGTGLTGTYIGYVTFRHKIGAAIVAESNPSPGSNTLVLANQNRVWTSLPTTCPNPRATHIALYVSVAGADAKFAAEYTIGTSTVTENVADNSLTDFISLRRGVPPYTYLAETFHDRVYYGGDPSHPERLWYSELNEPESVFNLNFISTQGGEAITGIKGSKDQLLVTCANSSYVVHGWDSTDITLERVSPSIGCIAPMSMVNLDEVIIFAANRGLMGFDGGFRSLTEEDMESAWQADYDANRTLYQDAFGCVDRETQCYLLLIPKATGYRYAAYYKPMRSEGAKSPWFSIDQRTRKDYTMGIINGSLVTGSTDGYIRQENVSTNDDDDGDASNKTLTILTRHEFGEDQGGEEHLGKKWVGVDLYGRCENGTGTIKLYAGEESALAAAAQYSTTIPTGVSSGYPSQNRWHFRPPDVAGQGLLLSLVWAQADAVTFRGYGMEWEAGPQARRPTP